MLAGYTPADENAGGLIIVCYFLTTPAEKKRMSNPRAMVVEPGRRVASPVAEQLMDRRFVGKAVLHVA